MEILSRLQRYVTVYLVVSGVLLNVLVVPKLLRGAELGVNSHEVFVQVEVRDGE